MDTFYTSKVVPQLSRACAHLYNPGKSSFKRTGNDKIQQFREFLEFSYPYLPWCNIRFH